MYLLSTMPLRPAHFRVLAVASLGQFLGTGMATMIGVVIPLLSIIGRPELTSAQQGLTGCMSLIGIMVGSLVIGRLSDRYGYLRFYRLCPLLVLLASLGAVAVSGWGWLILLLFLMGFGVGGEYSLDSDYISELMPARWRLFMVGVAKATSSLGAIIFALCCFLALRVWPEPQIWRYLFLTVSATTLLMTLLRTRSAESPAWLLSRGRAAQAQQAVKKILGPDVEIVTDSLSPAKVPAPSLTDMLRGRNLPRAILCGLPWACEGLGVYGIGVFLPILCIALGLEQGTSPHASETSRLAGVTSSVEITTLINSFMLVGFIAGLWLMRRVSHIAIQTWGFVAAAAGLLLLLAAYRLHWPMEWAVTGFCIFELFLNAGPHLMTFVLPSQIYPVADRSQGAGLAASLGKAGAVLGVFFIPVLLETGGATLVLWVSVGVMALGALLTAIFGRIVGAYTPSLHTAPHAASDLHK